MNLDFDILYSVSSNGVADVSIRQGGNAVAIYSKDEVVRLRDGLSKLLEKEWEKAVPKHTNFEEALADLIDHYLQHDSRDSIISAMELKIMALNEEGEE